MASATRSMTHCIFPIIVHQPHGMTELTIGQTRVTRHMETETPTKSPGCQTEKGRRKQVQHLEACKDPCLSSHSTPTPIQSMTTVCQYCFLNISYLCTHPCCNAAVQAAKFSWATRSLLTGLPAANIVILWNQRLDLCLLFL